MRRVNSVDDTRYKHLVINLCNLDYTAVGAGGVANSALNSIDDIEAFVNNSVRMGDVRKSSSYTRDGYIFSVSTTGPSSLFVNPKNIIDVIGIRSWKFGKKKRISNNVIRVENLFFNEPQIWDIIFTNDFDKYRTEKVDKF